MTFNQNLFDFVENITHDQICQVIQKANCQMTIVTRKPRSDEASKFNEIVENGEFCYIYEELYLLTINNVSPP